MANIDIFNLETSGSELFNDSENFLADLDEQEDVVGGYSEYYYGNVYGNFIATGNVGGKNQTGIVVSNFNSGIFDFDY
jgi:hypothetical protein